MRPSLKRAAFIAALILPTLAVIAPAAHATTYTADGPYKNQAVVAATYETDDPSWFTAFKAVLTFDANAVAYDYDSNGYYIHARARGAIQASGGSATLKISAYNFGNDDNGSCNGSQGNPTQYRVEIRNASTHAQIGSTDWTPTFSLACQVETAVTKTVYFDNDPLDGDNADGALAAGSYELYFAIEGGSTNLAGLNSEGGHGAGTTNYAEYTSTSTFTVVGGAMLGLIDNRTSDSPYGTATTNQGVLNDDANGITTSKSYAEARIYDTAWGLPKQEVHDLINAGKLVFWSNKPPTSVVVDNHGNNHNVSQWSNFSGANDGGTSGLYAQLETLYSWADGQSGHASQVVYVAVEHEPHDSASDWGSGGCATNTSGGNTWNDCHGTAAQYKAAWDHVRNALDDLENNGYPGISQRVLLAYCAVASNATKKVTGGVIGSGDTLFPGAFDADLLAHDVYNWYHFSTSGDGTNFNTTTAWKDPATLLGDANSGAVTVARQQGMFLLIGEFGSHPGCPGGLVTSEGCNGNETSGGTGNNKIQSRDDWFQKVADWVRTSDTQHTLVGFGYYHEKPTSACPCTSAPKWNWQFTDTANRGGTSSLPAGITGYLAGFVNNSTYNGNNPGYYYGSRFTL
ncbi:MAG: hypothetical protein QOD57_3208 [Actinomycetota bacterium]|jgi:hypothetical protein|nr:hypothetical protein [Actinomycetota bacterium]